MKETVIAIFDIGKTNKKIILFNNDYKILFESEQKFAQIQDDDGFECDDIEAIENWIKKSLSEILISGQYDLKAVNFTTYGATLVYLDEKGRRLTPVYNYLKHIDEKIPEKLYESYGGRDEFCRRTASPALGMLNSGLQALWLKSVKPDIFSKVRHILHLPQYLSYLLTGKIYSEHTSIGCHTALWDFDEMKYHSWLAAQGINLPLPVPVSTYNEVIIEGKKIKVGIGIHDSSASLAPYLLCSDGRFILLSTGTWCINMNPFNNENLTAGQLENDCLCYMNIAMKPVKSSRLFLGHMHETAVSQISEHFNKPKDFFSSVGVDKTFKDNFRIKYRESKVFFQNYPYSRELKKKIDLSEFTSFEESYYQLMNELCVLTIESVNMILPANDDTSYLYITGGFSMNKLFLNFIAEAYPGKKVCISEIANGSALGAAMVISDSKPSINLGLTECK